MATLCSLWPPGERVPQRKSGWWIDGLLCCVHQGGGEGRNIIRQKGRPVAGHWSGVEEVMLVVEEEDEERTWTTTAETL